MGINTSFIQELVNAEAEEIAEVGEENCEIHSLFVVHGQSLHPNLPAPIMTGRELLQLAEEARHKEVQALDLLISADDFFLSMVAAASNGLWAAAQNLEIQCLDDEYSARVLMAQANTLYGMIESAYVYAPRA